MFWRPINFLIRSIVHSDAGLSSRAVKPEAAGAIYILHRGERSNDLKRPPTASCRQCQTSVLSFGGFLPALFFDSLSSAYRRVDGTGLIFALASCQCRRAVFLMVWGLVDGVSAGTGISAGIRASAGIRVSAGIVFVAGTIISVSARALRSSSLSDFADSFGANTGSILL